MNLGLDIPESIEFTDEDKDALKILRTSGGWKVYIYKILRPKFLYEQAKLRKCRKSDKQYDKTNGYLDGLEFAVNSIDTAIEE